MTISPAVMFIAGHLKREIMLRGTSIPNFLKDNPEVLKLPKESLDYIKSQGKKMLMAMDRRNKK